MLIQGKTVDLRITQRREIKLKSLHKTGKFNGFSFTEKASKKRHSLDQGNDKKASVYCK